MSSGLYSPKQCKSVLVIEFSTVSEFLAQRYHFGFYSDCENNLGIQALQEESTVVEYGMQLAQFLYYLVNVVDDPIDPQLRLYDEDRDNLRDLKAHMMLLPDAQDPEDTTAPAPPPPTPIETDDIGSVEYQEEDVIMWLLRRIICAQFQVYMASQDSNWLSPPLNYLALSMVREDKSFHRPQHLSHLIAAMQYCARLAFSEQFIEDNSDRAAFNPASKPTKPFEEEWAMFDYLKKGSHGPFSRMRDLMHLVGSVIRNEQLPDRTKWVDNQLQVLEVEEKKFTIDEVRKCIHQVDQQAQNRYLEVVHGAKMPDFCPDMYTDQPNDTRVGYNYLRGSWQEHRQYSLHLIKEWIKRGDPKKLLSPGWKVAIREKPITDPDLWNAQNVWKWLREADRLLADLYFLYHVASGQPGRGTEETATQIVNSTTSPRNVFFRGSAMVIVTWYHKSRNQTGQSKPRLVSLSGAHTKLWHYLLGFIRPAQV